MNQPVCGLVVEQKHDVLKTFLLKHRAEVKDVCITEYDEKTFVDGIRAEGRAEERTNERLEAIKNILKYGISKEKCLKIIPRKKFKRLKIPC